LVEFVVTVPVFAVALYPVPDLSFQVDTLLPLRINESDEVSAASNQSEQLLICVGKKYV
jgi:hypothetical protein